MLNCAVSRHTNCLCKNWRGKSKRQDVRHDELTFLIGQCYPRKENAFWSFIFLEVFKPGRTLSKIVKAAYLKTSPTSILAYNYSTCDPP